MTILITGANGFLGTHVRKAADNSGIEYLSPNSGTLNLLDKSCVYDYIGENKVDTIIHLAAVCGGIGLNKSQPATLTHHNLEMLVNLFSAIWKFKIPYFYGTGSVCSYPCNCPVPFREDDMWNGESEPTNFGYGETKRMMITEFRMFRKQFGIKGAVFVPVNLYGPFDHFDLQNSHVMPALIRKFTDAKKYNKSEVEIWGDGAPTREFLYAEDCAKIIVQAFKSNFDYEKPINIGTGVDISIYDLAHKIKSLIGYEGNVIFNKDGGLNGQPRRRLDVSRARSFGFEANTGLDTGLIETLGWYNKNYNG